MQLPSSEMKEHLKSILSLLDAIDERNETFMAAQGLLIKERQEEQVLVKAQKVIIRRLLSDSAVVNRDPNWPKIFNSSTKRRAGTEEEIPQSSKRIKSEPEEKKKKSISKKEEGIKPDVKLKYGSPVEGKVTCRLCSDHQILKSNFINHVSVHHLDDFKAYQCRLCDYKNGKKFGATRHIGNNHKEANANDSNIISLIESVRTKIQAKVVECFGSDGNAK